MEKRRFSRITKCLPLEYSFRLTGSEEICSGKGFTQNISLDGVYFKCEEPRIAIGRLVDLNLTEIIHQPIGYTTQRFRVAGRVVRLEPPQDDSASRGIAVQFLFPVNLAQGHCRNGRPTRNNSFQLAAR